MKVDLSQIITNSELQPQIFKVTKSLSKDKKGQFLAVVDRNKNIISYIVSPVLFERLYNQKEEKTRLIQKMKKDYASLREDVSEELLETESLIDLHNDEGDMSPEEIEYYNNL